MAVPKPFNDPARSEIADLIDPRRPADKSFLTQISQMAQALFGTPYAGISVIAHDTARFSHAEGFEAAGETPRTNSLCSLAVTSPHLLVLPDTLADKRTADHPNVKGGMKVRFYVGAPVVLTSGVIAAVLCVFDTRKKDTVDADSLKQLKGFAALTAAYFERPIEVDADNARNAQKALRSSQDDFLTLVTHELRTPLNNVCGLTQVLYMQDPNNPIVRAMRPAAEHLSEMIENILHFSELSSGTMLLDERPVRLADLVIDVCAALKPLLKLRNSSSPVQEVDPALVVEADAEKLKVCLTCLMQNVLAHGGPTSRIWSEIDDQGRLILRISDDGPGIGSALRDELQEPFRIGEPLSHRRGKGVGLGLPLSRRLMEMHAGTLDMGSGDDGVGIVVTLTLPAWRVVGQARSETAGPTPKTAAGQRPC